MQLSIGINPISWSNDDLRYVGGEISLETCLSDASRAGYDGVELGHKFPRKPKILRPILDEYSLALVSGWYSGQLVSRSSDDEIAAMSEHAGLLSKMGCDVLIFAEVTMDAAARKLVNATRHGAHTVLTPAADAVATALGGQR